MHILFIIHSIEFIKQSTYYVSQILNLKYDEKDDPIYWNQKFVILSI